MIGISVFGSACSSAAQTGDKKIKDATEYNWSFSPAEDLGMPGEKTVKLTSCPPGVKGNEPEYWIVITGPETPEAVEVSGGSCAGDGHSGSLQFTIAKSHSAGSKISSASGGLQEALIAARFVPTNPGGISQSGTVIVPPGELKAWARVSIRASNLTVDFSGSIIECWMDDTCIFVGDPKSSTAFLDITLINPRGRPTVRGGQKPFIEVNAQKTRLINVSSRVAVPGGTFGTYVQVDDDEAFLLDGLDTTLGLVGLRCDATICNPAIYAPGPFEGFSAVGWLKHLNLSMQCRGNGIDWQSGNTLRVSDSVIQGYAQYGVRAGTRRGGYGGFEMENVYEEVGNCGNPAGQIGHAGAIAQGGRVRITGGEAPSGAAPQFANSGKKDYRYYIVAPQRKARRLESALRRVCADQWLGKHQGDNAGHCGSKQLRLATRDSSRRPAGAGAVWDGELCCGDQRRSNFDLWQPRMYFHRHSGRIAVL